MAHEYLLNNEKALTAFDEALKINPKIGLKRKADLLRKKIAVNGKADITGSETSIQIKVCNEG